MSNLYLVKDKDGDGEEVKHIPVKITLSIVVRMPLEEVMMKNYEELGLTGLNDPDKDDYERAEMMVQFDLDRELVPGNIADYMAEYSNDFSDYSVKAIR